MLILAADPLAWFASLTRRFTPAPSQQLRCEHALSNLMNKPLRTYKEKAKNMSRATRRSLVKGAAWAAPITIASTHVPLYAASKESPITDICEPVVSWWDFGANDDSGQLANPSVFTIGDVTVTLSATGAIGQPGNFYANNGADAAAYDSPGVYPNSLRLRAEQTGANMLAKAPQFITLKFSQPVENVSFQIADIDRHNKRFPDDPTSAGFQDQIFIPEESAFPDSVVLGSHLTGQGTPSVPWETKFVAKDPAYQGNQSASANYNLTLTWYRPVTEVTFGYKQGVTLLDAFPTVWIRPVTFSVVGCK